MAVRIRRLGLGSTTFEPTAARILDIGVASAAL
jgi:hypothetical protein